MNKHTLDPAKNERIFKEQIAPTVFDGTPTVSEPVVLFIGGQPGSGKSHFIADAERFQFFDKPAVINGDELRGYHPDYRSLLRHDNDAAVQATVPDVSTWIQKCFAEAQQQQCHVIMETTLRQPELVATTMGQFKEAGYQVELAVVAAPTPLSALSTVSRYANGLAQNGAGRPVDLAADHDRTAAQIPATISTLEQSSQLDRLTVVERSGRPRHMNERRGGKWNEPTTGAETVRTIQNRQLTKTERAQFERDHDRASEILTREGQTTQLKSLDTITERAHKRARQQSRDRGRGQ